MTIREDIDGYQPDPDDFPFDLILENAVVNNSNDKYFKIEGRSLKLDIIPEVEEAEPSVSIFPNPGQDRFFIQADGGQEIQEVLIYNMMGALALSYPEVYQNTLEVEHRLPQGIYTAAITTDAGVSIEKIQIINE